MNDQHFDTNMASQISLLLELSLATGSSLDLTRMCNRFCRILMSRLNLSATTIYVRGDRMGGLADRWVLAHSLPYPFAGLEDLGQGHPLAISVQDTFAHSFDSKIDVTGEEDPNAGCLAVFKLEDLGLFVVEAASARPSLDQGNLTQLRNVMDQFAVALNGCLDHRDLQCAMDEQKRTDQIIRQNESRLELVLSGSDLATWDWNILNGEVAFNDRWSTMLGFDPGELTPGLQTWEQLVHPDDWPLVTEALDQHLKGHTEFYETEHRLRHKNGGWVWVLDRGRVISRDAEGAPTRATGTHLDITARKLMATRTQRLGHLSEITTEVLNAFLNNEDIDQAVNLILRHCG
nr:PAS domain-containing protein [Candidatus Krumholzibacteria bacterium]